MVSQEKKKATLEIVPTTQNDFMRLIMCIYLHVRLLPCVLSSPTLAAESVEVE